MAEPRYNASDLERFNNHFDALNSMCGTLRGYYENINTGDPEKPEELALGLGMLKTDKEIVLNLLRDLSQFAHGQFKFFYDGFKAAEEDSNQSHHLVLMSETYGDSKVVQFPPHHVLSNILDQMHEDLTTIRLLAQQRTWEVKFKENPTPNMISQIDWKLFKDADALAQNALWPPQTSQNKIRGGIDLDLGTAITYVAETIKIRVLPYSKIALIGMPYKCLNDKLAYLSIPHEIGHFLYWYSYTQREENLETLGPIWKKHARRRLSVRELFYPFNFQSPRAEWGEEIFADVYGVLVGGPLSILTAMDLALEYNARKFSNFHDEHDPHPTPLIRPILMIKALVALNRSAGLFNVSRENLDTAVVELLNCWRNILVTRGVLTPRYPTTGKKEDLDISRVDFASAEIENQVRENVAWDTLDLDLAFPAEALVQKAINALAFAFRGLDAREEGWGWSSNEFAEMPDKQASSTMEQLYMEATERIEKVIIKARGTPSKLKDELIEGTSIMTPSEDTLWDKWVIDKGYFESLPATGRMYAGEFPKDMDPRNRPNGTWLPVFGAGGWDTHGPCAPPPL